MVLESFGLKKSFFVDPNNAASTFIHITIIIKIFLRTYDEFSSKIKKSLTERKLF